MHHDHADGGAAPRRAPLGHGAEPAPPGDAAQPRVPVALAARHRAVLRSTRCSRRSTSRSRTTTGSARRPSTAWTTGGTSSSDYPFFWPALRNTLWLVVVMVTLRVIFGLAVGMLVIRIKRGAGLLRTLFYAPYLAPPVAGTLAFVFLLNPGTGPVNTILGRLGLPEPGLVQRPGLVEAGAHPAGAVGHRRPDGDLHGRAARRAEGAVRGGRAGRGRRGRPVPLRHAAPISPIIVFAVVTGVIQTMQYYTQPLVAGQGRQRAHRRLRAAVRARLPGQVDADAAPARLQPRLPALRHRLGLRGRAGAVRAAAWCSPRVLMRRGAACFLGGSDS